MKKTMINQPNTPIGMSLRPNPQEEEVRRQRAYAAHQARQAQMARAVQAPTKLASGGNGKDTWGENNTCLGLKLLCGGLGLVILVLLIILIVKFVVKPGSSSSGSASSSPPSSGSGLPLSLEGGGFGMESMMSTE